MKPETAKSWSLEIDYSRAPCLGADQKARGFWDRYWVAPRALVFRPLVKGNEDSGNEIGQRGQDVARCHFKRHLAVLALEKRFKSISHFSVEHFAMASAVFFSFCWVVWPFRERNNFIGLS